MNNRKQANKKCWVFRNTTQQKENCEKKLNTKKIGKQANKEWLGYEVGTQLNTKKIVKEANKQLLGYALCTTAAVQQMHGQITFQFQMDPRCLYSATLLSGGSLLCSAVDHHSTTLLFWILVLCCGS